MAASGRTLIGSGLLILAFVGYQLWGTSLAEARSQDNLRSQFSVAATKHRGTSAGTPSTPAVDETPPPVPQGNAVAIIKIPKIGVDKAVVEGVGVLDLKKGPGHYPETPLPGEAGNAAIAGHRTTYGAPFYRLDELSQGDPILVTTISGTYRYVVRENIVVTPEQVEVLNASPDNRLTLTTCEPRFSAAKRLIIVADLVPNTDGAPAPTTTTTTPSGPASPAAPDLIATSGLSGEPVSNLPALVWGLDTALVAYGISRLAKRWRRWPAYLLGAAPFLIFLYLFFESFSRLLPANY